MPEWGDHVIFISKYGVEKVADIKIGLKITRRHTSL
jgi:hypothetical protein